MNFEKSDRLYKQLFAGSDVQTYKRRDTIVRYGEPASHVYLIESGCVKVITYTAAGDERILNVYGPEDLFSMCSLLDACGLPIAFTAQSPVRVRKCTLQKARAYLERNPEAMFGLLKQQHMIFENIINLNLGSAEKRVASRLLSLYAKFGEPAGDYGLINLSLTIRELADMVSLTRETTGKILAQLEQRGSIMVGRLQILVKLDELRQIIDHSESDAGSALLV